MLRRQRLGRSVQSVESRACRARTRQAPGARLHIELSGSMRHGRDSLSRTRSLFLRARYGRGRMRDCGRTRRGRASETARDCRESTRRMMILGPCWIGWQRLPCYRTNYAIHRQTCGLLEIFDGLVCCRVERAGDVARHERFHRYKDTLKSGHVATSRTGAE